MKMYDQLLVQQIKVKFKFMWNVDPFIMIIFCKLKYISCKCIILHKIIITAECSAIFLLDIFGARIGNEIRRTNIVNAN